MDSHKQTAITIYFSIILSLSYTIISQAADGGQPMQADTQAIEHVKARIEPLISTTEGLESVSIGIGKDGKPCLMLGVSLPENEVRKKLPADLFTVPIEFMHIGKINAQ